MFMECRLLGPLQRVEVEVVPVPLTGFDWLLASRNHNPCIKHA